MSPKETPKNRDESMTRTFNAVSSNQSVRLQNSWTGPGVNGTKYEKQFTKNGEIDRIRHGE